VLSTPAWGPLHPWRPPSYRLTKHQKTAVCMDGRWSRIAAGEPLAQAEGQGPRARHAQPSGHLAGTGRRRGAGCHRGFCLPRLKQARPNPNEWRESPCRVLSFRTLAAAEIFPWIVLLYSVWPGGRTVVRRGRRIFGDRPKCSRPPVHGTDYW
jgi:hypothetical protein